MLNNLELLKKLASSTEEVIYKYYSGLDQLDKIVGGFRSKQLYVISARAGVGKTSLLVSICAKLAIENVKSCIFSLELSKEEMCCRLTRNLLRDANFQFDDIKKIQSLIEKHANDKDNAFYLASLENIFVIDGSMSIHDIEKYIDENHNNIRVFGVDYTGLIQISVTTDTPDWKRLGIIVENLKRIANKYNIVLFLINHLNRAMPTTNAMSEQGGSIDFERLATCIMQIYEEKDKKKRTIKITKNRMGSTGDAIIDFNGAYDAFF